jgi:hypothetical protein
MTVKTYPSLPMAFAKMAFPTNLSPNASSNILHTHISQATTLTDLGIFLHMQYFTPALTIPLIVWYNHTKEELDDAMNPYLAALRDTTPAGYTYDSRLYSNFLDMFQDQDIVQDIAVGGYVTGGRLLPRSALEPGRLDDVLDYYVSENINFLYASIRLPNEPDRDRTAVSDAWRKSRGLLIPTLCVLTPHEHW